MAEGNQITTVEKAEGAVAVQYDVEHLTFAQRVALDPSIDVDRLEKIIQMERDSDRYKAEQAYSRAMAEMQPKLPAVEKTGQNLHLKSNYAKLEDIQSAIRPLLAEYGFSVRWTTETIDGKIHVTCICTHREGHSERDTLPLPVMTDARGTNILQQHGVTVSYGKRYTLCNVLGIQLGGDDQDGIQALSGSTLSEQQVARIRAMLKEISGSEEVLVQWANKKGFQSTELEGLPFESFDVIEKQLAYQIKQRSQNNAG